MVRKGDLNLKGQTPTIPLPLYVYCTTRIPQSTNSTASCGSLKKPTFAPSVGAKQRRKLSRGRAELRASKFPRWRVNLVTLVAFFQQGVPSWIAHRDHR